MDQNLYVHIGGGHMSVRSTKMHHKALHEAAPFKSSHHWFTKT
jgi:hypothetical protein